MLVRSTTSDTYWLGIRQCKWHVVKKPTHSRSWRRVHSSSDSHQWVTTIDNSVGVAELVVHSRTAASLQLSRSWTCDRSELRVNSRSVRLHQSPHPCTPSLSGKQRSSHRVGGQPQEHSAYIISSFRWHDAVLRRSQGRQHISKSDLRRCTKFISVSAQDAHSKDGAVRLPGVLDMLGESATSTSII